MKRSLVMLAALMLLALPAVAQHTHQHQHEHQHDAADSVQPYIVNGQVFDSLEAYVQSDYFRDHGMRCQAPQPSQQLVDPVFGSDPSDCSAGSTNPDAVYDPGLTYQVPVVVHILRASNGTTGEVPDDRIYSQIDILNEDFQAIAGSNGAPGTYTGVHFVLADEDAGGAFSDGITRSDNTTWYNDGGSYWNTLSWDTNRYMNLYVNQASGALGYVPGFPQNGIAGTAADRVVVLTETFGRNAPLSPFNLGRTGTHEVGHYFGLYHTFQSGCGTAACNATGDLICDTNAESNPYFGCAAPSNSCGSVDPIDNYMDYSDDACMNKFTEEQMRRMRCTMQNYRPSVYSPIEPDQIFLDGWEDGDLAAWDEELTDGGDLAATMAASQEGDYSMGATINDLNRLYVTDNLAQGEDRYRARFYLDPNSFTTDANKRFKIMTLFSNDPDTYRLMTLTLRYDGSDYWLRAKAHRNPADGTWAKPAWVQLDDDWNLIELDWKRASTAAASDGYLRLWINNVPFDEVTLANGERQANFVRFGVVGGVDANTAGTIYFDGYESRESLYIGK
ncbi:MAG: zinc metalloprotease [Acidobacteriota bacterium]